MIIDCILGDHLLLCMHAAPPPPHLADSTTAAAGQCTCLYVGCVSEGISSRTCIDHCLPHSSRARLLIKKCLKNKL